MVKSLPNHSSVARSIHDKSCSHQLELVAPTKTASKTESIGESSSIHCGSHSMSAFDSSLGHDENNKLCSICLCGDENGHAYMKIDLCSHEFHVGCLLDWLQVKDSCPCCRRKVNVYSCKIIRTPTSTPTQKSARKKGCSFQRIKKALFCQKEEIKNDVEDYKDLEEALITLRHAHAWLNN